ncbi:hypothetical protein [uncultured Roseivirga sp.]|uniref:hypothetical protein n=1 Tax=uncultured Roseivirga sp. TaxID=543088 RepID=UPI000D7A0B37|nr:hypothetical protein [uncultured Roseivirga sp.]PWL29065.1 MAG: hypothetical protein DCO95_11540 [Roseivirga sp. XM-24bin3]
MAIKQSLEANKNFILDSLPTQELKDDFLKSLENAPESVEAPSVEQQVKEAEAPDYVTEEMYAGIKTELENMKPVPKMTPEEEKAAIEEGLKNPPKSDANNEEE